MNRDETIELFDRCEAARRTALDAGKSEAEAHETAKAVWNGWAEAVLAEKKAMRKAGTWKNPRYGTPNEGTMCWRDRVRVDFSNVRFGTTLAHKIGTEEQSSSIKDSTEASISVRHRLGIDFSGFIFPDVAEFRGALFACEAWFSRARFLGAASFALTKFDQYSNFSNSYFMRTAIFYASEASSGFDLDGAVFDRVPSFIQAHFREAPRLDNIRVNDEFMFVRAVVLLVLPFTLFFGVYSFENDIIIGGVYTFVLVIALLFIVFLVLPTDRGTPARCRALKRLAVQGHDADREHMFFELEVRAARFVEDWPVPLVLFGVKERWREWRRGYPVMPLRKLDFPLMIFRTLGRIEDFLLKIIYDVFRTEAWAGFWRFWFGLAYEIFGGLGSSILRPAFWWLVSVFIAAMFYLGANPEVAEKRLSLQAKGAGALSAYLQTSTVAWREGQACYEPEASTDYPKVPEQDRLKSLPLKMREITSAPIEALQLAARTSFILLDSGSDARSYGCLYGVLKSDNGMLFVPPAVSIVVSMQKVVSAVLLFLFGLALRNLLKLK